MAFINLTEIRQEIAFSTEASELSPSDAYSAWATALGIDPAATLASWNDNDTAWFFDTAAPFFLGSTITRAFFSTEAGIGLFNDAPLSAAISSWTSSWSHRFYGSIRSPLLVLTWHSTSSNLKSYNTKLNKSGDVTIIFASYSTYNDTGTNRYDVAIRISPQKIELVGASITGTISIRLWELQENNASRTPVQTVSLVTQLAGTTSRVLITAAYPTVYSLSGHAKFSNGAIATLMRVWRRDTGAWVLDTIPDPVSGAYQCQDVLNTPYDLTIFRDGYRPLTHGPIMPHASIWNP